MNTEIPTIAQVYIDGKCFLSSASHEARSKVGGKGPCSGSTPIGAFPPLSPSTPITRRYPMEHMANAGANVKKNLKHEAGRAGNTLVSS
jgi:hypothetical protein